MPINLSVSDAVWTVTDLIKSQLETTGKGIVVSLLYEIASSHDFCDKFRNYNTLYASGLADCLFCLNPIFLYPGS